jgi:hypothetical protein
MLKTLLPSGIAGAASTYRLVAASHFVSRRARVGAAPTSDECPTRRHQVPLPQGVTGCRRDYVGMTDGLP